jgi:prepilin-type N-terminal cleavage/methylation domain-containing protein
MERFRRVFSGFTLAELLISLAILGVIGTFTIPKILGANQNKQNVNLLKEAVSALSAVVYQGYISGDIKTQGASNYLAANLNAAKLCVSSGMTSGGCMPSNYAAEYVANNPGQGSGYPNSPGLILTSGVWVWWFPSENGIGIPEPDALGIFLDANGAAGPNKLFVDIILAKANYSSSTYGDYWGSGATTRPGQVGQWYVGYDGDIFQK